MHCCCWNIASDEWEVDYWKSEVITFVVEVYFQSPSVVNFNVKIKARIRYLSVSSIFYFKLIYIDEMQIITELRIVQWQSIVYLMEDEIKGVLSNFLSW